MSRKRRAATPAPTRQQRRHLAAALQCNSSLQRQAARRRGAGNVAVRAQEGIVPNISARSDSDQVVHAKLKTTLQRMRETLAKKRQEAKRLKRKRSELHRELARTTWDRTTFQDKAELQYRREQLGTDVFCAYKKPRRTFQRAKTRLARLSALWNATNGSGRRIVAPQGNWALTLHAARSVAAAEKANERRREELDVDGLLEWSATNSTDESSILMSNSNVCPRCLGEMMATAQAQLFCAKCVLFIDSNNASAPSMLLEQSGGRSAARRGHSTPYQSSVHFLDHLKHMMGAWFNVPPNVFVDVVRYLYKYKIPPHDHSTLWVGREALLAMGHKSKFYNHVHLILSHISTVAPPQIPPVLRSEFSILIRMIHSKWREIQRLLDDEKARQDKLAGRKVTNPKRYSPNVGFCMDFIAVLRGHPELMQWNWSIHDPNNIRQKDAMMELVCKTFNWEFVPTTLRRLGGDAGKAVERRKVSFRKAEAVLDAHDWQPLSEAEAKEAAEAGANVDCGGSDANNKARRATRALRRADDGTWQCRGLNYEASVRLGRDAWARVDLVVRSVLNWRMLLSEYNPWEKMEADVAAVEQLAHDDDGIHHIHAFLLAERKLYANQAAKDRGGHARALPP